MSDIGKKKVDCVAQSMKEYGSSSDIYPIPSSIDDESYMPITIAAFDNMEARRHLFNNWKKRPDRELFIDGR